MRIISGYLGGRLIVTNSKSTHPMSEKMRGSIFNALGDLDGLDVLDAFSGSGAIGFEAVSRGANKVLLIESNKSAQKDIDVNIRSLGVDDRVSLVKASVDSWLSTSIDQFDIIVIDPPYDQLKEATIIKLEDRLRAKGVLILSYPPNVGLPKFKQFEVVNEKKYGDGRLVFYKNNQ